MRNEKMRLVVSACLAVLLPVLLAGCRREPAGPQTVEFELLVSEPETYDGRPVCTAGTYVSGFEAQSLGATTYTRDGVTYLVDPVIWIEGAEMEEQGECFDSGGIPPARFCPVIACGIFETGGGFGHLGTYWFQLRAP